MEMVTINTADPTEILAWAGEAIMFSSPVFIDITTPYLNVVK